MQTISFLLFRLQPPEPAVRIADIRRILIRMKIFARIRIRKKNADPKP